MGEQTKNMLIGGFVIASCITIIWLILFLKPSVGDNKQTLYVRFSNINQIIRTFSRGRYKTHRIRQRYTPEEGGGLFKKELEVPGRSSSYRFQFALLD